MELEDLWQGSSGWCGKTRHHNKYAAGDSHAPNITPGPATARSGGCRRRDDPGIARPGPPPGPGHPGPSVIQVSASANWSKGYVLGPDRLRSRRRRPAGRKPQLLSVADGWTRPWQEPGAVARGRERCFWKFCRDNIMRMFGTGSSCEFSSPTGIRLEVTS